MVSKAIGLRQTAAGDSVFAQVGAFLNQHRLSPVPAHYAFAYEVISRPDSAMARAVAGLTDGGFRLTERDIEELTGTDASVPPAPPIRLVGEEWPADQPAKAPDTTQETIERALDQLDGFAATVNAVHAETNDFGRDLMRSAEAMRTADGLAGAAEITRLTAAMIERVRHAETRLAQARRESDELKVALDEARGAARTDALTELANRRAFDEAFLRLAPDSPVTVAICDIDHFKHINDSFGHAVGDRVLRMVAQTLADEAEGIVARYGGEEFALLFERAAPDAVAAGIDRIRGTLATRRLRVRETGAPIGVVSFSAGVATGRAGQGRAALMAQADAALYRAKHLGRARTELAP